MKTKFRFHWYVKLISFGVPLFILALPAWREARPHDIFLWAMASISLIGVIINLFTYYTVSDKGLLLYSIPKKIKIDWDDIEHIVLLSPQKSIGISVRVCISAKGKKIYIISWIKDYKEILKRVLAEAEKRKIPGIDREVVALLKTT